MNAEKVVPVRHHLRPILFSACGASTNWFGSDHCRPMKLSSFITFQTCSLVAGHALSTIRDKMFGRRFGGNFWGLDDGWIKTRPNNGPTRTFLKASILIIAPIL